MYDIYEITHINTYPLNASFIKELHKMLTAHKDNLHISVQPSDLLT